MYNKILEYVKENRMLEGHGRVIAGLSGGADSVCLLDMLDRMKPLFGYEITAVHIHHGIRGEEADRDMYFCEELCRRRKIEFVCRRYDVPALAEQSGIGTEEAGRLVRYRTFSEEAKKRGGGVIAVAHHGDDRAETVIFNLSRGTGIRGLIGIRPVRDNVIRPLLCCSRKEIEEYLECEGLEYCTDSTNTSGEYARNRIRHGIIPQLEEINEGAVRNICGMSERMRELSDFIDSLTEKIYSGKVRHEDGGIFIAEPWTEDRYIQKCLIIRAISELADSLRDIGDVHIEAVAGLITAKPGAYTVIRKNLYVRRDSDGLFFYGNTEIRTDAVDVTVPSCIIKDGINVSFKKIPWEFKKKFTNELYTKFFDYDKIKNSLQLRNRREGDYFVADGMGHRKKLSRYFIDEKIPGRRREEILLLADGSHVMWIIGGRISEEYKITEATKNVLVVKYGG